MAHQREEQLPEAEALDVSTLGEREYPSFLARRGEHFVADDTRILLCSRLDELERLQAAGKPVPTFERAGPRERLFFDPGKVTCGVVTCGGLCPGLNNVIRSVVRTAQLGYGVRRILGFRYGYEGIVSKDAPLELTAVDVEDVHNDGGSFLGTSRGPQDVGEMVDCLVRRGVDILFTIGGDGTLRGSSAIAREAMRRGVALSVVGVPKSIDNDVDWIRQTFGFATAVEEARQVIFGAHVEARGARNGVAVVKLMGRYSGFIAAHATLASSDVDFCLIPEVPFDLDGDRGLLRALERRFEEQDHAVIVVAEGAGQEFFEAGTATDKSGNAELRDIGIFLKDRIRSHFAACATEVAMKYIDPSYIIRSLPANAVDSEYCLALGQHAVHAGMAGKTDVVVGSWNRYFTNLPISIAVQHRRQVREDGVIWPRVLEATGQPRFMRAAH